MTKSSVGILLMVMGFCIACKKTSSTNDSTFNEITASSNFNWSTTKLVDIRITGLSTETPVRSTLQIGEKNSISKFYIGAHAMSDNITVKITVPTALDSVQLDFGTVRKMYNVKGVTAIDANYLPTIDADPQ
jgi:hypothetical protein